MDDFFSKIKKILSSRQSNIVIDAKVKYEKENILNRIQNTNYKSAAVLFPIIRVKNENKIIFTTRSKDVLSHPGQVCFPGGRFDKKDKNMIECAKREAYEEIGLESNKIDILGILDNCITGTNYNVTPIVGYINEGFNPTIQESEVADIFEVPLSYFFNKKNRKLKNASYRNKKYTYYEYKWKNRKIWGSTARIIVNFCDIIENTK